jgi:hypothetical protein
MAVRLASASTLLLALLGFAADVRAEPVPIDRAVVRFVAPETGGADAPQFIYERTLAFEARLEALADPDQLSTDEEPYRERHVRAAMDRHIAEALLAALPIDPEPSAGELERQTEAARLLLLERAGGPAAVESALVAERLGRSELNVILRRQARASLYVDRMIAPMLSPSEGELRAAQASAPAALGSRPFDEVAPALRRWYVAGRLHQALSLFRQNARSRLRITLLEPLD